MRRSSSFWRSSPRACTSTAVVTTLPVTLDTALVHQPPTTPVIGSLSTDDGMARMATRPLASRCTLTRNSPLAAPSASRKSPNVARFRASSRPPTAMRCHSQLRPPGWRGVSACRMTRLTSLSAAARVSSESLMLCSPPLDGRKCRRLSSTRPVTSTVCPRTDDMAAASAGGSMESTSAVLVSGSMRGYDDSVGGPAGSSASVRMLERLSGRSRCAMASSNSARSRSSTRRLGRTAAYSMPLPPSAPAING